MPNPDDPLLAALRDVARQDHDAALSSSDGAELLRPPEGGERDRIVEGVLARLGQPGGEGSVTPIEEAKARRGRRRPVLVVIPAMAGLAAAAALALVLRPSATTVDEVVPGYHLQVENGHRSRARGEGTTDFRLPRYQLDAGEVLRVALVPDVSTPGPLEVRVFVRGQGAWQRIEAAAVMTPHGSFSVEVARSALPASLSGGVRLLFAVGRPSALPDERSLAQAPEALQPPGERARLIEMPLRIGP